MAKNKKTPDIQKTIAHMIKMENSLNAREAERQRKADTLEREFRDLVAQAESAAAAGKQSQVNRLYARAKRKAEVWKALQGKKHLQR